ncbi:MAG: hypothetical protein HY973_01350 [Candidatus Kerfeldbacteria bacterium]|nr:hypothetical protein [Candidatus Kerfeldbacteria bacterium]
MDKIASDSDLFAKKVCAKEIFGSHLLLGEKTVRPAEGGTPNSFGKMGGNQWDALRASHLLALEKPLRSVLVPHGGLELPTYPMYIGPLFITPANGIIYPASPLRNHTALIPNADK